MLAGVLSTMFINRIFFFSKKKKEDERGEEESKQDELICRFVLDGIGRKIGESVAVDDDVLIIKNGGKYLGVPLKHVEINGKTLVVKGLIDRGKAEMMGEKWRQENFKELKI